MVCDVVAVGNVDAVDFVPVLGLHFSFFSSFFSSCSRWWGMVLGSVVVVAVAVLRSAGVVAVVVIDGEGGQSPFHIPQAGVFRCAKLVLSTPEGDFDVIAENCSKKLKFFCQERICDFDQREG